VAGFCECGNETLFCKMREISLLAEILLASHGLCSMKLEWCMPVRNDSFLASMAMLLSSKSD
jgi:hypothetical protein